MTALRIILLLFGVFGAVFRPLRLPAWSLPVVAVVVALVTGAVSPDGARTAVDPLLAPIGFLLAAVPLAALLDRLGFFSSVATILTRGRRGVGGLWAMAAVVTALLNLDAGVVLLTPLYVGIARRTGRDPLTLALAPVLLACLASSFLPVSNLTNLIAAARTGADSGQFLANLGLPSLVAVVLGWLAYRRFVVRGAPTADPEGSPDVIDRRALFVGGVVMVAVLVGFVAGHDAGIEPWEVAAAADVVLLATAWLVPGAPSREIRWRPEVPWRSVPVGTALVALCLGVLADAAATHLHVARLISGTSSADLARTAGLSALAANLFNNLPALLVALPALGRHTSPTLWAVLLGVNMGPVLLVTGSLASLLWLETLNRMGVAAHPRDFARAGAVVGLPAGAAALGVSLLVHAFGWG